MSHVYGDSTSFPFELDYIDLARHAIDCAVQLLSAQHAIAAALERSEALNQERRAEAARIAAIAQAVERALAEHSGHDSEVAARVIGRVTEGMRAVANEELVAIERQSTEEVAHGRGVVTRMGESAHRALESFLARHDVPPTELALSLAAAGEQAYAGQVALRTPFGIAASFQLAIAPEHPWARPRRVSDLASGLEIRFPQPSGWLSKRVEMAPLKLDKMFVSAVRLDAFNAELRLRKGPHAGSGYRLLVELAGEHKIVLQPLGEDGTPDSDPPLTLDGEESAQIFRLCSRVIETTQGLTTSRRGLVAVELDSQPLNELSWPQAVAERLIAHIAPIVNEISRRSGAPGELVLRRDVGGGRREEMYVTKAELREKVLVLPPARRAVFDALGLAEAAPNSPPPQQRSARPPAASAAAPEPEGDAAAAVVPSLVPAE